MESALRRIFRARQSGARPEGAAPGAGGPAEEGLARELHHRVNNTIQMVSSLLQLQANDIRDPRLLEAFQDCQARIRALALIHRKLHWTGALAQIDFREYLESLMDALLRAQTGGAKVRRQFNLEPVVLGIDTAIPLGLIASELISNSLKRSFAGRQEGVVSVSLSRRGAGQIRLAVGDDGCGATAGFLDGDPLGLRLVKILTGQIRGQMEYKNENGADFVIVFKDARSNST